ncbi:Nn.00g107750.m01.CDS01 [Neocucurbitaria sp. VM-36]
MSAPYTDDDVALPHASLLSYFRRPTAAPEANTSESSPPPYSNCHDSHLDLFNDPNDPQVRVVEDEESQHTPFHDNDQKGSYRWNVADQNKHSHRNAYAFCCFWCSLSTFILAVLAIFFVVDLGFSQFGYGTGMARSMIHWNARPSNTQYEVSKSVSDVGNPTWRHMLIINVFPQMHFCLATPNREAPGPQSWRYMSATTYTDCVTEIVTLLASPSELSKLHPGDEVSIGSGNYARGDDEVYRRLMSVEGRIHEGLGDDLAEEGRLKIAAHRYSRGGIQSRPYPPSVLFADYKLEPLLNCEMLKKIILEYNKHSPIETEEEAKGLGELLKQKFGNKAVAQVVQVEYTHRKPRFGLDVIEW